MSQFKFGHANQSWNKLLAICIINKVLGKLSQNYQIWYYFAENVQLTKLHKSNICLKFYATLSNAKSNKDEAITEFHREYSDLV